MSLDRSLRSASSLVRHRNVLKRGERLLKLAEAGKWSEDKSPLGLPKVGNRKLEIGKPAKEAPAADAAAAAAPAPAAGAKGAAGKAAAAPAAAAGKAAAPAAKPAAKK
jgi:small basic protein (TIGR04137 family)